MLRTVPLSETILIIRKYFIKISRHLTKYAFFKTFRYSWWNAYRSVSFLSFFSFLCKGVTSSDLRHEGKVEDLIELLMLFHNISAKISIFLYNFGRDIRTLSRFIHFQVMNFFSIFAKSISSKANSSVLTIILNCKNAWVIIAF